MPVEIAWEKIFLNPKGKGEYRVIGLVEVLWKFCAEVVNCPLKRSVVLHDALHRFRTERGMGKATLESNLTQQLAGLAPKPLL